MVCRLTGHLFRQLTGQLSCSNYGLLMRWSTGQLVTWMWGWAYELISSNCIVGGLEWQIPGSSFSVSRSVLMLR